MTHYVQVFRFVVEDFFFGETESDSIDVVITSQTDDSSYYDDGNFLDGFGSDSLFGDDGDSFSDVLGGGGGGLFGRRKLSSATSGRVVMQSGSGSVCCELTATVSATVDLQLADFLRADPTLGSRLEEYIDRNSNLDINSVTVEVADSSDSGSTNNVTRGLQYTGYAVGGLVVVVAATKLGWRRKRGFKGYMEVTKDNRVLLTIPKPDFNSLGLV